MRAEPLQKALTTEQREAGLYLEEEGDHFLHLKRGTKYLATFYQTTTTVEAIRQEADRHLKSNTPTPKPS